MDTNTKSVTINLDGGESVSGLVQADKSSRACYVFAHGAGAGMTHTFMAQAANGLLERGIATLRFQFPYMEQRLSRPDSPKTAHATVLAAVEEAAKLRLPLFAGGKSFGGRMTSQAQAISTLPGVHGLIFFGFPLHPAGKPSDDRATHLYDVHVPMLFLQGTRDDLAHQPLIENVCQKLGQRATVKLIPEANHSFHVPARTGRRDPDVLADMLDTMAEWIGKVL